MDKRFEPLDCENDVLHVNLKDGRRFFAHPCFKVSGVMEKMKREVFAYGLSQEEQEALLGEGIDCEILRPDARGWQKGKVRFSLEFCPDESKSPLDDLRQQISEPES